VPVQAGGYLTGKQLGRDGPGGSGGHQGDLKPVTHSHSKKGQWHVGCIRKRLANRSRGWSVPSTQHWWGHIWSAGPSSGLPGVWHTAVGPAVVKKMIKGLEGLSYKDRLGLFSQKRQLQRISSICTNTWLWEWIKTKPNSSQCQDKSQWAVNLTP